MPANGRRRLPRAVAGALAATLCSTLMAGCGGSSNASGAGGGGGSAPAPASTVPAPPLPADQPQKAACGLASKAEVEAAVGSKVNNGKEESQPGRSLCLFSLASAADQSVVLISTTSSGAPAYFTDARTKAVRAQAVTAGEEAFVSGPYGLVRRGNTMVTIVIALRLEPPQSAAVATKLAVAVGTHI